MSRRGPNQTRNADTGSTTNSRDRSRSPLKENITQEDLRRIVAETMATQIPRLILETSKVVSEQIASDGQDNVKSYTAFSQEMKALKQKQEEVAYLSKAASLKSDGMLCLH